MLADDDSIEAHIRDTLISGAGLCDAEVTRQVVEHGRETVEWLINEGVPLRVKRMTAVIILPVRVGIATGVSFMRQTQQVVQCR